MTRRTAILLPVLLLAGCAGPDDAAGGDQTSVPVRVLYANECPAGSTCAPVGGGAGGAELVVDGQVANVTDVWGTATLVGIAPGEHEVCARHRDLGTDLRRVTVVAGGNDRVELMLRHNGPACPSSAAG